VDFGGSRRVWPCVCTKVMRKAVQIKKTGETRMAMEKKSLVSKKTAAPTKSKSVKSEVDTRKPAATKVVSASSIGGKVGWH
jgi:hypothetical protein